MFRIIVPLDEAYSYDFALINGRKGISDADCDTIDTNSDTILDPSDLKAKLLRCIEQDTTCTQKEYAKKQNVSVPTVKRLFAKLQKDNLLVRDDTNRKEQWKIIEKK